MIRKRLRAWLLRLAFGEDPAPLLVSLRVAAMAVRATREEIRDHAERLQRLEQSALVAVDAVEGASLRERVDPYLESVGVLFCTASDARAIAVRPLERMTLE